ncbi:YitT family protein [Oceanivirga salmonicida]|nr:YitT family protein [Oceanivirga salmonicida]
MKKRMFINVGMIIISSIAQAYLIKSMLQVANLVPMGFTGLSILLNMLLGKIGIHVSVSFLLVLSNVPVAIMCMNGISKKFAFLSLTQIIITSIFLQVFNFSPLFNNTFLEVVIGGYLYGLMNVLALRGEGSTGGTDFIALYVSNKIGKPIWEYVFIFNAIIILIFGYNFGWVSAGYSIVFQYIVTRTIATFYLRYSRATLQIITKIPEEVSKAYTCNVNHGMTALKGEGCYLKEEVCILYTVVSTYEIKDIVKLVKNTDPNAIINVLRTEQFYGKFNLPPM